MPGSEGGHLPTSLNQRQFWILHRQSPRSTAYHIPSVVSLEGDLNVDALCGAFNALLRRHDAFRSRIEIDEQGNLVQRIRTWRHQPLPQEELRPSSQSDAGAVLEREVNSEIRRPFDLSEDLPIRMRLFRTSERSFVLVIVAHHGVFDLATRDLFAEELSREYCRLLSGSPETGGTAGSRYEDYCVWQKHWLESDESLKIGRQWQRYLEDANTVLHMPTDRPRPAQSQRSGSIVHLRFPSQCVDRIRKFSRDEAVTPYLVLLTAWVLTLRRWSGEERLCVGIPLTNRRREELKRTMGCFVNTLPLAINLTGNPTLKEVLRGVRAGMLALHRMQEMPYLHLAQMLRGRTAIGDNPLFRVGFTFIHPVKISLAGLRVEPRYVHQGDAQLDLFATLWEEQGEIAGVIEYSSELYDEATVVRIGESFRLAVDELAGRPHQAVDSVSLLPQADLHRITHEWNATKAAYPDHETVHGQIAAQAGLTPGAVAVRFEREQLTYSELCGRARALARQLRNEGVSPGEAVGVCVERNIDMVPVLLGVLLAGGAYVPLDPVFPSERLQYMVEDAGVHFVVGSSSLKALAETTGRRYVEIDGGSWDRFLLLPDGDELSRGGDIAYVMYTSGSTGKPKGVEVPHRAVVNFLAAMSKKPGLTAEDVLLSVTTVSFDISVLELFLPLARGACVAIAPAAATFDGKKLLALMEKVRPTVMQATPVTWRLLLGSGWKGSPGLKVLCGGEAMTSELMQGLLRCSKEVWNMYGPTETTVWSTCQRCHTDQRSVLIGKPIDNTVTYILDTNALPVPVGAWGELYVGGDGVARGYRNKPDLTAERFVPDQITPGGGIMYRTGDRCRYRHDGTIEHGGRLDFQVKVRGFRIEPGDIESFLARFPAVQGAAVDTRTDAEGQMLLIAWVLFKEGQVAETRELRNYLRLHVPEYMIPQVFKPVERFPLTPNKKVDRKALPDPWGEANGIIPLSPPQTVDLSSVERDVRAEWMKLLSHGDFGIDTPFFDAGGYSLLAVRLSDALSVRWDHDFSVQMVFQYSTIRQQAALLKKGGRVLSAGAKESDRGRLQAAAVARIGKIQKSSRKVQG